MRKRRGISFISIKTERGDDNTAVTLVNLLGSFQREVNHWSLVETKYLYAFVACEPLFATICARNQPKSDNITRVFACK